MPVLEFDWQHLFGIEKSILELVIRGTVMYWFLFVLFRFVMRRDVGAIGIADVLLIVIIADAAQNAMGGDYRSITEGMVVVGTLVFWNVLTNWLNFRSRRFERFSEPAPLLLVRDGRVLEGNLRREMLTQNELMSKLRQQSIERVEEVRWAYMESDGQISVRRYRDEGGPPKQPNRAAPSGG
jgi:uncharacterized membrane protein YcaP (DUF421 family)